MEKMAMTKTEAQLVRELGTLLEVVAHYMTNLRLMGVTVTFNLNYSDNLVSVLGYQAMKEVSTKEPTATPETQA